jgi:hypothetical protein
VKLTGSNDGGWMYTDEFWKSEIENSGENFQPSWYIAENVVLEETPT